MKFLNLQFFKTKKKEKFLIFLATFGVYFVGDGVFNWIARCSDESSTLLNHFNCAGFGSFFDLLLLPLYFLFILLPIIIINFFGGYVGGGGEKGVGYAFSFGLFLTFSLPIIISFILLLTLIYFFIYYTIPKLKKPLPRQKKPVR